MQVPARQTRPSLHPQSLQHEVLFSPFSQMRSPHTGPVSSGGTDGTCRGSGLALSDGVGETAEGDRLVFGGTGVMMPPLFGVGSGVGVGVGSGVGSPSRTWNWTFRRWEKLPTSLGMQSSRYIPGIQS